MRLRHPLLAATAGLLVAACAAVVAAPVELQEAQADAGAVAASPVRGSWAGRAPGTYVEYRRRLPGRPPFKWVFKGEIEQYQRVPSTEPAPAVEESLLRLTLVGRETSGHATILREATTQLTTTRPDDDYGRWDREPPITTEIGYSTFADPQMRLISLRRDTITLAGHAPIDCTVRDYELRNVQSHLQQEIWTLASTDDQRDGSEPDALILRVRHVETRHAGGHRMEITIEPESIGTERLDGQPIRVYSLHCSGRELAPDGAVRMMPTQIEVYSPDVPAYFVRGVQQTPNGEMGRWIETVGVDAGHLEHIRQGTPGEPSRLALQRLAAEMNAQAEHAHCNEVLYAAAGGSSTATAADVLERLDALESLKETAYDAELNQSVFGQDTSWTTCDNALRAIVARPMTPEVGRRAAVVAARRGLRIEPALLAACDNDPDGLGSYVQAAALLGTPEALPVMRRGATADWAYIRAAAADALSRLDDPAATAACEQLARDASEDVRAALLQTPGERLAADAAVAKARTERYQLAEDGEWYVPFEPPRGKPSRAAALVADYTDETWADEPDDAVIRPTAIDGKPGAAAFWGLPRIDALPAPEPDEGQRDLMQGVVIVRSGGRQVMRREPEREPATRPTPNDRVVRQLPTALLITLSRDAAARVRGAAVPQLTARRHEPEAAARLVEMIDDADSTVAAQAIRAIGMDAVADAASTRPVATRPAATTGLTAPPVRERLLAIIRSAGTSGPATRAAQLAQAAFVADAQSGDARVIEPARQVLATIADPSDPRVIGAAGALRLFASDRAALDALAEHAMRGPNADLAAHALATVREERAAPLLLARVLAAMDALDAAIATRPAATQPTSQASVTMGVSSGEYRIDRGVAKLPQERLVLALVKAIIRSADATTIERLHHLERDATPARREVLLSLLDAIATHQRGEFVTID